MTTRGKTDGSVAADARQTDPSTTTEPIHSHTHEAIWVKRLAQGHDGREWDGAGFEIKFPSFAKMRQGALFSNPCAVVFPSSAA